MQIKEILKQSNPTLWALSIVSLLWSVSSCMVFSILPTFITEELKINAFHLGWIDGTAFFLAFAAKIISGILSDYFKKRKPLLLIGTFLSITFKVFFALATNGWWIFLAKTLDRFSKGIRSSPADALIADLSKKEQQGRNYGLRQSLYTFGAVLGSLFASFFLKISDCDYRFVFWLALIPAILGFVVILFFVKDVETDSSDKKVRWNISDCKKFPPVFWQIIGVSFILMMARFSESFLSLKARDVGLSVTMIPLLMIVYDLVHSIFSFPTGIMADLFNKRKILLFGIFVLMITNMVMIRADNSFFIILGYALAGLHMGMTHSLLSTLIAQYTLPHLRGTAFSIYYLTTGIAVLIGNPLAGYLSHSLQSASAPFMGGLFFSSLSFILLFVLLKKESDVRADNCNS